MGDDVQRESVTCVMVCGYITGILGPILAVLGGLQHFGGVRTIDDGGPTALILFIVGILFYVVHLCGTFQSKSGRYLLNVMSEREFQAYVEEVQNAAPVITWTIQNYHYETRTTRDKDGNERTERKRVNTHYARDNYDVRGFLDETLSPQQTVAMFHLLHDGEHGDPEAAPMKDKRRLILLCHMPLEFYPVSVDEQQRVMGQRDAFYKHNTMDAHQDKNELESLSCTHRERVMVVLSADTDDGNSKPLWMNFCVFLVCTMLLLSVPYQLYFFSQTQKVDWTVCKHYAHTDVETWKEEPQHSRSKRTDAASRAFRAKPRETPCSNNVARPGSPEAWGENSKPVDSSPPLAVPVGAPSYWKNQDLGASFDDKIKLSESERTKMQTLVDATFKMKATRDRQDGPMPTRLVVEQVLRMEDCEMWKRYEAKRSALARGTRPGLLEELPGSGKLKTMPKEEDAALWPDSLQDLVPELNEGYLFHGSNPAGALGIGENGFDMSRVGKNIGTMFGAGAYFAEASSKSDEYGSQDPSGVFAGRHAFLLCRVLLGNMFHITESNIPRIEDALATGRFQTVLGDRECVVDTYREFVVFDQDQIYPEYVVIYRRSFD